MTSRQRRGSQRGGEVGEEGGGGRVLWQLE